MKLSSPAHDCKSQHCCVGDHMKHSDMSRDTAGGTVPTADFTVSHIARSAASTTAVTLCTCEQQTVSTEHMISEANYLSNYYLLLNQELCCENFIKFVIKIIILKFHSTIIILLSIDGDSSPNYFSCRGDLMSCLEQRSVT